MASTFMYACGDTVLRDMGDVMVDAGEMIRDGAADAMIDAGEGMRDTDLTPDAAAQGCEASCRVDGPVQVEGPVQLEGPVQIAGVTKVVTAQTDIAQRRFGQKSFYEQREFVSGPLVIDSLMIRRFRSDTNPSVELKMVPEASDCSEGSVRKVDISFADQGVVSGLGIAVPGGQKLCALIVAESARTVSWTGYVPYE